MAGENKSVRVTAGLDDASFAKAKRMIDDLTSSVSKLVQATGRLNFGGGRVTGAAPVAGAGSSNVTQAASRMAGGGIGGATDGLTRAVTNSAALFKAAATGSKGAFKIMSDALRSHVSDSDREIKRLTQSLQGLERSYDRLKSKQGRSGGSPLLDSAMSSVQGRFVETADALKSAQGRRQNLYTATHDLDEAGGGYQHSKSKGFWSKPLAQNPVVAGISQTMGIPAGAIGAGSVMAAITAGAALGSKLAGTARTNEMANIGYALDKPMFSMNARGQAGQIFGGNALAIRHGDMARVAAMTSLSRDPGMKDILGNDPLLKARRDLENPFTLAGMMAKGGIVGGGWDYLKGKIGSAGGAFLNSGSGKLAGVGSDDVNSLARDRASQEQQALKAQMYQQALEAKMQEDPGFNDRINSFYGGALGNAGLMRAAGQGGGNVRFGGKNGVMMDQSQLLKARAIASGYDVGEYVGSMQEMAGTAGRGFLSHGTSMLGMKSGGLHNAASLFSAGAQFNGGNAKGGDAFMRQLQGKIGRGGLDVTAASSLFSAGAGMMTGGNFASSGGGAFMGTLADAAASGTTGGDMLGARQVTAGLGSMANMMAGGIDPLQMALNSSAALKAAPSGGYSAHKGLMDMSPADVTQVLKTNQVSESMRMRGISVSMVRSYVAAQDATTMGRYAAGMGTGTEMGAAAGRYQKAGGLSYLSTMSQAERRVELRRLAEVTHDTTGVSLEAARGQMLLRASMEGYLKPVKGRGAHDSLKRNTSLAVALGAQATEEFKVGAKLAGEEGLMKETFQNASTAENSSEGARKMAQKGMRGDPGTAIAAVSKALTDFVNVLQGLNGDPLFKKPTKAGPPVNSASR